jgi:hypothetical protein
MQLDSTRRCSKSQDAVMMRPGLGVDRRSELLTRTRTTSCPGWPTYRSAAARDCVYEAFAPLTTGQTHSWTSSSTS